MGLVARGLSWLGHAIARRLQSPLRSYEPFARAELDTLRRVLMPGDVILVDGDQKLSAAIKYLTQSTWSHSALYAGNLVELGEVEGEPLTILEVEIEGGCMASPLSKYSRHNLRICRPVGLTPEDRQAVIKFMVERIGVQYDIKNIIDLARYLLPTPPVPVRWRRRMIQLGSGDPTRAICSSMIAEAFQSVQYPILPDIRTLEVTGSGSSGYSNEEIYHIRHHSLYTPRDFDLSPYFSIVKPTLEFGFDYKSLSWAEAMEDSADADPAGSG